MAAARDIMQQFAAVLPHIDHAMLVTQIASRATSPRRDAATEIDRDRERFARRGGAARSSVADRTRGRGLHGSAVCRTSAEITALDAEERNVKRILLLTALSIFPAAACATYTPQRYTISADNNIALRATGGSNINVGSFRSVVAFDDSCRGAASISPPDDMTFEAYLQKALTDELKIAGMFDDRSPRITLTGTVEQLSFSSTRAVTGGTWDIGLRVSSSNGKSTFVAEHYEFKAGYDGAAACNQTAEAFLPAVQDLIGKLVRSPAFRDLIAP